jgi:hypothetical protein
MEILKKKSSINKLKISVESTLIDYIRWKKEYQGLKTRLRNYYNQMAIKKNISNLHKNIQDLWDMVKRPNLQIYKMEPSHRLNHRKAL